MKVCVRWLYRFQLLRFFCSSSVLALVVVVLGGGVGVGVGGKVFSLSAIVLGMAATTSTQSIVPLLVEIAATNSTLTMFHFFSVNGVEKKSTGKGTV